VQVSAIIAPGETRGEMDADGKNFRVGELTLVCYGVISVSEARAMRTVFHNSSNAYRRQDQAV
jgi:hypothetical protein